MAPINTGNKSNVGKIAIIVISGSSWKLTLAPVFDLCLHDDALPLAMLEQSYKHSTIWCVCEMKEWMNWIKKVENWTSQDLALKATTQETGGALRILLPSNQGSNEFMMASMEPKLQHTPQLQRDGLHLSCIFYLSF